MTLAAGACRSSGCTEIPVLVCGPVVGRARRREEGWTKPLAGRDLGARWLILLSRSASLAQQLWDCTTIINSLPLVHQRSVQALKVPEASLETSLDHVSWDRMAVAARKDVTIWKRFMPPLPRLLGGLFAGLLMVH